MACRARWVLISTVLAESRVSMLRIQDPGVSFAAFCWSIHRLDDLDTPASILTGTRPKSQVWLWECWESRLSSRASFSGCNIQGASKGYLLSSGPFIQGPVSRIIAHFPATLFSLHHHHPLRLPSPPLPPLASQQHPKPCQTLS